MKVSIVVPALNEEKCIEGTLKSLRAQEYAGRLELIVADGNSTDKTVPIAKKYCDRIVTESTRTIAAGRQTGTRSAGGEVVLYTDADGRADPHWAARMTRAFEDPNVVAAFGMIEPLDSGPLEHFALKYSVLAAAAVFNWLRLDYVYGNNMAVRKSVFEQVGGFDIYLVTGEDTDVMHRMRSRGKIVFVPDAKIYYSTRRIRKWGYWKYLSFHFMNFFKSHVFKKPARYYEPIR